MYLKRVSKAESLTPLWNNEITPNGLAQKGSTDFYKLETKPM